MLRRSLKGAIILPKSLKIGVVSADFQLSKIVGREISSTLFLDVFPAPREHYFFNPSHEANMLYNVRAYLGHHIREVVSNKEGVFVGTIFETLLIEDTQIAELEGWVNGLGRLYDYVVFIPTGSKLNDPFIPEKILPSTRWNFLNDLPLFAIHTLCQTYIEMYSFDKGLSQKEIDRMIEWLRERVRK